MRSAPRRHLHRGPHRRRDTSAPHPPLPGRHFPHRHLAAATTQRLRSTRRLAARLGRDGLPHPPRSQTPTARGPSFSQRSALMLSSVRSAQLACACSASSERRTTSGTSSPPWASPPHLPPALRRAALRTGRVERCASVPMPTRPSKEQERAGSRRSVARPRSAHADKHARLSAELRGPRPPSTSRITPSMFLVHSEQATAALAFQPIGALVRVTLFEVEVRDAEDADQAHGKASGECSSRPTQRWLPSGVQLLELTPTRFPQLDIPRTEKPPHEDFPLSCSARSSRDRRSARCGVQQLQLRSCRR